MVPALPQQRHSEKGAQHHVQGFWSSPRSSPQLLSAHCAQHSSAAWCGCGCPIPGAGIQGQAGCGSGQSGLVVGNRAHSRGVETMITVVLFNPGHSMILQSFLQPRTLVLAPNWWDTLTSPLCWPQPCPMPLLLLRPQLCLAWTNTSPKFRLSCALPSAHGFPDVTCAAPSFEHRLKHMWFKAGC